MRQFFQLVEIRHLAFSVYDPLQDLQHTFGSLSARNTFSTAFTLGKVHKETGYLYHTGVFIHDYQSTGSHDGIQFLYRIKVQRRIQLIQDQTSAGRSADLYALESSTTLESAADIINNMTKCCSHRHFDQTGIFNGTGQRECLCSWASLGTDGTEPVCTFQNDLRYVGICLYVIQYGRFLPQTFFNGTRWFNTRHTSVSFDRCRQGGSLTTYESTCTTVDMQMEIHIRTQDMIT